MSLNGHRNLIKAGPGIEGDPYRCPFCGDDGILMEFQAGSIFGKGLEGITDGDPVTIGHHDGPGFHHMWWVKGHLDDEW